jgi:hypothetical protein
MKLLIAIMFVLSSSLAFAEEVSTDCPWSNQDNRNAGKNVKSSSPTTNSKGSKVKAE